MPLSKEEIENMKPEEKYELAVQLWNNLDEYFIKKLKADEELKKEIDKRIARIDAHPEELVEWESVLAKMSND